MEIVVFLASLLTYVLTSSHSIVHGDTGDFLSAAATGGIPHSPGYPFYSLIARIAYLLPLGDPTWQVNLLSAVFASISLVFVFKIVKILTKNSPAALFAVLVLGIYQSFWFYALVSEIHVLQVLILSILFFFLILYAETRKIRYLYLTGLMFGLGVSNNHTIIFSLPSILLVMAFFRKELDFSKIVGLSIYSAAGLLPYLYTIFSSRVGAPTSWGGVRDLNSFLNFFFRADYGTFNWVGTEPWAPFRFSPFVFFWKNLFKTSWFLLPFSVLSLLFLKKIKKRLVYITILLAFILTGPLFYLLMKIPLRSIVHISNSAQFLAYPYFFFSILSGIGLGVAIDKFKLKNNISAISLTILMFTPVFIYNLPRVRLDNNNLTQITTKFQLSELPENAILITYVDSISLPAKYWQYVEKYRPDIIIVNYGLFSAPWYRQNLKNIHPELIGLVGSSNLNFEKMCDDYSNADRLFLAPRYPESDTFFKDRCKIIPYGLVNKVIPKDSKITVENIKRFNDHEWERYNSLLDLSSYKSYYFRTRETLYYLGEQHNFIGTFYLDEGKKDWALNEFRIAREVSPDEVNSIVAESAILFENQNYPEAIEILEDGIKKNPAVSQLYKNLGVIYQKVQRQDKAYENLKIYLSFRPIDDSDIPGIKTFIFYYENTR